MQITDPKKISGVIKAGSGAEASAMGPQLLSKIGNLDRRDVNRCVTIFTSFGWLIF